MSRASSFYTMAMSCLTTGGSAIELIKYLEMSDDSKTRITKICTEILKNIELYKQHRGETVDDFVNLLALVEKIDDDIFLLHRDSKESKDLKFIASLISCEWGGSEEDVRTEATKRGLTIPLSGIVMSEKELEEEYAKYCHSWGPPYEGDRMCRMSYHEWLQDVTTHGL